MVLTISKAQMQSDFIKNDEDYAAWYVHNFMKDNFPEAIEIIGETALIRMTLSGMKYARHFGFCTRNEQGMFLTVMDSFGADFWHFPGFQEIIYDSGLSPEDKFYAIFETLSKEQKDAAAFNANPDYWFDHLVENNAYLVSTCNGANV